MSRFNIGDIVDINGSTGSSYPVESILPACMYPCSTCTGYAYKLTGWGEICGRCDIHWKLKSGFHRPKQFKLPGHE